MFVLEPGQSFELWPGLVGGTKQVSCLAGCCPHADLQVERVKMQRRQRLALCVCHLDGNLCGCNEVTQHPTADATHLGALRSTQNCYSACGVETVLFVEGFDVAPALLGAGAARPEFCRVHVCSFGR